MSAVMEEAIKRWTARRKSQLVLEIIQVYKLGNYPTPGPRQGRLRGECVRFVFGCHLRLRNDGWQCLDRERFA